MTAALGLVIVAGGWFVYQQRISAGRPQQVHEAEIAKLDKEIDEIKDVKDKIAALLAASRSSRRCRPTACRPCTCSTNWCGRCPRACS
jgi:hypothetical protein